MIFVFCFWKRWEKGICWSYWEQTPGYSCRFCSFLWWKEAWKLKLTQFISKISYSNRLKSSRFMSGCSCRGSWSKSVIKSCLKGTLLDKLANHSKTKLPKHLILFSFFDPLHLGNWVTHLTCSISCFRGLPSQSFFFAAF